MISKVLGNRIKRNQIELLDIKVALGVISKVVEQEVPALFSHRNPDLTSMYEPKYLYEISRIQLRDCSTSDKHKSKNNLIERGGRSSFTLPMSDLPEVITGQHCERSPKPEIFPLGEREAEACIQHLQVFEALSKRPASVSLHPE